MTYRALALWGSTCLWLAACGDDAPVTPGTDSSSSGSSGDATGPGTTSGPGTTDEGSTGADTTGAESGSSETTEGAESSSTGPQTECGNGVIEAGEVCEEDDLDNETCITQGFVDGDLACAADCTSYDTRGCATMLCGNNTAEDTEACDGPDLAGETCATQGFDSGTVSCAADCTSVDTSGCGSCGNVVVDGDEVCDDIVLLGETCQSQGFDSGDLGCAADCLSYDTTPCGSCGNAIIDGNEACDGNDVGGIDCAGLGMGFDSGSPVCAGDCLTLVTDGCGICGNGFVDGAEVCEGILLGGQTCQSQGFDSGVIACLPACAGFDTSNCGSCGNGAIDGSEACDGADLGALGCAALGLTGGALGCTAGCDLDLSGCTLPGTPFGADPFYVGVATTPAVSPCDDISATGTATGLGGNGHVVVPLGFSFDMYQTPFTDASVGADGTIHFGADMSVGLSNTCIPNNTPYVVDDYIIAAFWDDLDPGAAGEVYTQTLGAPGSQRFVVQWDVPNFAGDPVDLMRIQAVLHENGDIQVCYPDTINGGNTGDSGAQATAGIQRDETTGLQFSCNTPALVDGLSLLYVPQ